MTRTRAVALGLVVLAIAYAGCNVNKDCRPGTAFITLHCPAGVSVDHFEIDARDLTSSHGGTLDPVAAHCPSTGVELQIPGYAAGDQLSLTVRAIDANSAEVGRSELVVPLKDGCTSIDVAAAGGRVGAGGNTGSGGTFGGGGAGADSTDAGAGADMAGTAGTGVTGTGGSTVATGGVTGGTGGAGGLPVGTGGASGGKTGSGGSSGSGGATGPGSGGITGSGGRAAGSGGAPVDAGVDVPAGSGGTGGTKDAGPDISTGCGAPGATCSGNVLTTCAAGGTSAVMTCDYGCSAARGACNACNPASASVCTSGTTMKCRADGSGIDSTTCNANGCRADSTDCLSCTTAQHGCSGVCASNTSPLTCGTSCTACSSVPNGTATCDGTNCGFSCPGATMACNAGTNYCENTSWTFESALNGWTAPMEQDAAGDGMLVLSTGQAHGGTQSAAENVSFTGARYAYRLYFWPCGRSPFTTDGPASLDLRGKTVAFWVYMETSTPGVPATGHACSATAASPSMPCIGCGGTGSPVTLNAWSRVTLTLGAGSDAANVTFLGMDCRPVISPAWTGKIYVDDISIQ